MTCDCWTSLGLRRCGEVSPRRGDRSDQDGCTKRTPISLPLCHTSLHDRLPAPVLVTLSVKKSGKSRRPPILSRAPPSEMSRIQQGCRVPSPKLTDAVASKMRRADRDLLAVATGIWLLSIA